MTLDLILEIAVRVFQGGLMAWLWRTGGKIDKNYRRIIAPILAFIITRNVAVALMVAGIYRIPVTLVGDELQKQWQLLWWVPVFCFLHAIPILIISGVWPAIAMFVFQYVMIAGSNVVNFPTWNWYEKIYGFALGALLR